MQPAPMTPANGADSPAPQVNPDTALPHVGGGRLNGVGHAAQGCDDAQREVAIQHAGREIEQHIAQGDRAAADAARVRMEDLIRGRSPEQVARLEQERGLR